MVCHLFNLLSCSIPSYSFLPLTPSSIHFQPSITTNHIPTFPGQREPSLHPLSSHLRWRHNRLRPHRFRPQHRCRSHCWCAGTFLLSLFLTLHPSTSHSVARLRLLPQYGLGGYRIQRRQPYGVELALLASVLLAGSSIPRAIKTGKPLPAGLSVLAATGLVVYGKNWMDGAR